MNYHKPQEIIECKCGERHNVYDYDTATEFPCPCGEWLYPGPQFKASFEIETPKEEDKKNEQV